MAYVPLYTMKINISFLILIFEIYSLRAYDLFTLNE